jgi:RNA recognition motif-containing protein
MALSPNAGSSPQDSKTLWVGDIENWMDDSYIANLFNKFSPGTVQGVKIIRDKNSGAPMGYGFVEFASHEVAARLLQLLNGTTNPATHK